jgi:hypothetical protein
LEPIILFAILLALVILPVMLAARIVGAGRTGFGAALVAVILQGLVSAATRAVSPEFYISVLVAVLLGSAIYAFVLDTTLIRGLAIGVLSTVIAVAGFMFLGGLLSSGTVPI